MARFRRSRGRSSRRTVWCGTGSQEITVSGTTTGMVEICPFEETSLYTNPTIVGVRGDIDTTAISASLSAASGGLLTLGLIVVDAESAATMLNPADVDAADRAWLWRGMTHMGTRGHGYWNGSALVTESLHAGDHFRRWELRVKAQRKVPTGEELRLCYRWVADVAGNQVRIFYDLRTLLKE